MTSIGSSASILILLLKAAQGSLGARWRPIEHAPESGGAVHGRRLDENCESSPTATRRYSGLFGLLFRCALYYPAVAGSAAGSDTRAASGRILPSGPNRAGQRSC